MLKTPHISASGIAPCSRSRPNTGGTGSGASIAKPTRSDSRSRFASPPPVMCASPCTGQARAQQVEHRANVDHRRLEQRVRDRRAAQVIGPVVEPQRLQHAARQRVAVGVQAARRQADQRVARRAVRARHDAIQRDGPEAGGGEVEAARRRMAADQLGQHGDLAARDLDAGLLGAGLQPAPDRLEDVRVGLLDGEVVEHRDRLGADADHVVHVHGDAVDPDGVVAAGELGHDQLRADAVGPDRDAEVRRHFEHGCVVARQRHGARGAAGVDRPQHADERADRPVRRAGVDAGHGVCVATCARGRRPLGAHRARLCRTARMAAASAARHAAHGHSGARRSIPIARAVASVDANAAPAPSASGRTAARVRA